MKGKKLPEEELTELRHLIVGSIDQRVDRIQDQLDDPERRAKMAEVGRERITGPLSWRRSAEHLRAAYDRALAVDRAS